jgi:hypothetical protein
MARNALHPLTVASAGFATFLACQAALHVRNLDAWPRHISSFVYESWGTLWTVGIVALGVALAALAYAAAELLPRPQEAQWAVSSLCVASCAVLLMAVFPTDVTDYPSTPSGYVHDFAAVTAVTFQCAAMFFTLLAARVEPLWRQAAGEATGWPWLASALGLAWGLGDLTPWWPFAAFVQRILATVMVAWLLALAWRLRVEVAAAPQAPIPLSAPQRVR